ncbi:DUF4870 domain-containing protein [bacterium]|nr:DUF4870 domain-containing protein [bacterium]
MEKFVPEFKDDNDRMIMIIMIIASIFFMFVTPMVVSLALKDQISESSYNISKAFLNFEILLLIVSLIFVIICMVPIIGWIVGFVLGSIVWTVIWIFNVVIVLMAVFAIAQNKEVQIPVWFKFV